MEDLFFIKKTVYCKRADKHGVKVPKMQKNSRKDREDPLASNSNLFI